jgi:hypothetical protein
VKLCKICPFLLLLLALLLPSSPNLLSLLHIKAHSGTTGASAREEEKPKMDHSNGNLQKAESGRASPPPHYGVATQAGVVKAEGEH